VILDPVQQNYGGLVTGLLKYVVSPVLLQGEIRYGIRSVINESGAFKDAPADILQAIEAQSFGVIMTQLMELNASPLIEVISEDVTGVEVTPEWNPFTYTTPAFTVMFAFFLTSMAASSLLREKEEGSMRRLLASPIQRGAILAGKMLAYAIVVCMQVIVLFSVAHFVFDMPLGNPLALFVITAPLALTATGLGMLLAALVKSAKQADSIGNILAFVLAALGGCLSPFFLQGGMMGMLSRLTPHAHAMIAYMDIMNEGATWLNVLPQAGILLGFALVFYLIASWRFKFG
jgi:ABC-2 type transport system permease protein